MLSRHQVSLCLLFFFVLIASAPLFGARKPDTQSSGNGLFFNCPPTPGGPTCPVLNSQGAVTLSGTDAGGNAVSVTISLYDWGFYPCTTKSCQPAVINSAVLDVVLTGSDSVGIQSFVVKGIVTNPGYVTCGGPGSTVGLSCLLGPAPDGASDIQQPTPIAGSDYSTTLNTRWDFGGLPPSSPPLPAIPFDQLVCSPSGFDAICGQASTTLGEAILTITNSVASNHLSTSPANYLVTLTDGTQLGSFVIPASPTTHAPNNTQATATLITAEVYHDYNDTSLAFPGINADGSPSYPAGFALAPVPPTSSSQFTSCYPINSVTGKPDTRTFRTVWYTYTAPLNGSITVSTVGSRYDTLVYVFTGSATQPTPVSCNDDPITGLLQGVTTFNAIQGTTYQMVVYEAPPFQTNAPGALTGYPLSVDGTLYFNFQFSTIPPKTTTSLTSLPNPSVFGQSVTFTAKVTSKRPGIPTGTVTVREGSTVLGKGSLGGGGTASISGIPTATGTNTITATYSGDSNFNSSSGSTSQTVSQATTTVTISSNNNPSGSGQPVTFTATIKPQYSGQATGAVTFNDSNGTTLGSAAVKSNVATLTTTTLTVGTHLITAIYGGDTNFGGSTSKALSQVVKYASATSLTSSPNPSTSGSVVNFTVRVTSTGGTAVGTVQILNGTGVLTTLTLQSGTASYSTSQLGVGSNTITAVFSGNSKTAGSTSPPINQVVNFPPYFSVIHAFSGGDGSDPIASVALDGSGNLYGTTVYGGANGLGTVFKVDTTGTETVLHSFTGQGGDGANPYAGLVLDAQGNLYGTTNAGGNLSCGQYSGCGTVFEVTTGGAEKVLYAFQGGTDGLLSQTGLVRDAQGNLFGTTYAGGNLGCDFGFGCGTVFKLDPTGAKTILYNFSGTDGQAPQQLTLDSTGNLYGTTYYGGVYGDGTVFKLDTTSHLTLVYSFTDGPQDGSRPAAGVLLDSQGNLYGTTTSGGANYVGTVFKVDTTGQETILYNFTGTAGDGEQPYAGLVLDSQGNLYGTDFNGGNNSLGGTVFKINANGTETVLYRFTGSGGDGFRPEAGMVMDASGNLYGTTTSGGTAGNGTVFRLTPPY